jgi:hypothetical protein
MPPLSSPSYCHVQTRSRPIGLAAYDRVSRRAGRSRAGGLARRGGLVSVLELVAWLACVLVRLINTVFLAV